MANRFGEFWDTTTPHPVSTHVGAGPAFVLCPCAGAPTVQFQAAVLYRLAFEQAQAEVARERQARWTAFSVN